MIDENTEDREPWEFIPNMETERLNFNLIPEEEPLIQINCFQAYEVGFLTVESSQGIDHEHGAENLTNKGNIGFAGLCNGG